MKPWEQVVDEAVDKALIHHAKCHLLLGVKHAEREAMFHKWKARLVLDGHLIFDGHGRRVYLSDEQVTPASLTAIRCGVL